MTNGDDLFVDVLSATVYKGSLTRRYLTKSAAYEAQAQRLLRDAFNDGEPCWCSSESGDYGYFSHETCDWHDQEVDHAGATHTFAAAMAAADAQALARRNGR